MSTSAIQSFTSLEPRVVRDVILINYLNVEYTAFLVTSYISSDDDVSIKIDEHVEVWIDSAWVNLQLIDVQILSINATSTASTGDTIYEGDVTIVDNTSLTFATTNNGDTIYGSTTTTSDDSVRVDWFNMDGSPYTGDTSSLTIVNQVINSTVKVYQKYTQVDAAQNVWLAFLEVLVFDQDGSMMFSNYVSYGGVNIVLSSNYVVVDAPISIQIQDVYQVDSSASGDVTVTDVYWDSSQYFVNSDVVGVTLNIFNSVNWVTRNSVNFKIKSSSVLTLNSTSETIVRLGCKTYNDLAPLGRRCGTSPKVRLIDGAKLVANIEREVAPVLTRNPDAISSQSMT